MFKVQVRRRDRKMKRFKCCWIWKVLAINKTFYIAFYCNVCATMPVKSIKSGPS